MEIQLGQKIRDTLTGFKGICTGLCQYLTGCNQALVNAGMKEDGTLIDPVWFDVDRLEVLDEEPFRLKFATSNGPDAPAPTKN